MRLVVLACVVGLLTVAAPTGSAQSFEQCGDLTLVFRNPDLAKQSDGLVHASGNLFAQFQAIGPTADQIETFGFSFGVVESPITEETTLCDQHPATWFTGAYVQNYRADTNPDDGFFINLQTDLVPDGRYTAAVHAYDGNDNELARAWTNAVVNNCDADGPVPPARCEGDTAQISRNDATAPWPILLPGDGDLEAVDAAPADATLTVEFAEELSSLVVLISGTDVTDQLQTWPGRLWDDDLIPGYGPYGLGSLLVPECSQPTFQTCGTLGSAYYYNGPVTPDDVVRIEAIDMAGNVATKELHIASGTTGAITDAEPILQITVDTLTQTIKAGESALFRYALVNSGGATAHPIKTAEGPEDWDITWTAHDPVEPGETSQQELSVLPPLGTPVGTYLVNATIAWDRGAGTDSQDWTLKVNVGDVSPSGGGSSGGDGGEEQKGGDKKESPGLPVLPLLVMLGALAVARRRR